LTADVTRLTIAALAVSPRSSDCDRNSFQTSASIENFTVLSAMSVIAS
jgi:hypothetical protein